jgi:hypothetical protein
MNGGGRAGTKVGLFHELCLELSTSSPIQMETGRELWHFFPVAGLDLEYSNRMDLEPAVDMCQCQLSKKWKNALGIQSR